jgi:hypothetical protein
VAGRLQAVGKQWWSGDQAQRYWMELVNVDNWGSELIAPDEPRHALMYDVNIGDVIFHWVGKNNPLKLKSGMYGASVVAGPLNPHAGEWEGAPANTIELTGYTAFEKPRLLTELRLFEPDILLLLSELSASVTGAVHFPFSKHKTAGLKPNQRYLTKLPVQMLEIVPSLRPESDWGWNG